MSVLNYKLGPWWNDETRPGPRQRGQNRRITRRIARRHAKRADDRTALVDMHLDIADALNSAN
ncbi:hypothetical protein [Streptomyces bacillaris]|uniref:hypothetical protein n=1 Tax=Streptomyces bacillaris TaxID=68179 RepID=UPI0037F99942